MTAGRVASGMAPEELSTTGRRSSTERHFDDGWPYTEEADRLDPTGARTADPGPQGVDRHDEGAPVARAGGAAVEADLRYSQDPSLEDAHIVGNPRVLGRAPMGRAS